jgi:hypothetical protein
MSIYKQIFATASIFAIAASALVMPTASAQFSVSIASNSTGYTFCTKPTATTAPITSFVANNGYSVETTPATITTAGTSTIYVVKTSDVNNYSSTSPFAAYSDLCNNPTAITIPTFLGHKTSYDLEIDVLTAATASVPAYYTVKATNKKIANTNPSSASIVKSCSGNNTVFTITGTEGDKVEHISNTINTSDYDVTPSGSTPLVITVKARNTNTPKAAGVFVYVKEILPATPAGATLDETTKLITINTDIDPVCVATVSSSSMSSSSMMSSAAAVTSSATAAASSKATVTIEEPAMNAGKGTSTVRTGGAY